MRLGDAHVPLNVKTSAYDPDEPGASVSDFGRLHLFVKIEELRQPCWGYIQLFVHLEGPYAHIHVGGAVDSASVIFHRARQQLRPIPGTGHMGLWIRVKDLVPLGIFVEQFAGYRRGSCWSANGHKTSS